MTAVENDKHYENNNQTNLALQKVTEMMRSVMRSMGTRRMRRRKGQLVVDQEKRLEGASCSAAASEFRSIRMMSSSLKNSESDKSYQQQ